MSLSIRSLNKPAGKSHHRSTYLPALVAASGGFVVGYDSGAISGILAMPAFAETFLYKDNAYRQALLVAMMLLTATLGGLISGQLCDSIGRKRTILVGTYVFALGALFETIGVHFAMLIIGRLLVGFGEGFLTNAIPLYHSEIAPPEIRGRLISLYSCTCSLGTIVGYFVNFGTSHFQSSWCWRTPFLIQLVICILLSFTWFLPFSPRWLIDKGRTDEALQVIAQLHGTTISDPDVLSEFETIVAENHFEQSLGERTWKELFQGTNLKRTLFALFTGNGAAFTGTDAISYYAPQIFKQAGLQDTALSLATSGASHALSLVVNVLAMLLIDRIGRRLVFASGAFLMGASMYIVGALFMACFELDPTGNVELLNPSARNSVIAFIFIFQAAYAYSWGPVAYIYPAEILNMRCRAKGLALAYGLNWTVGIFMTFVMPIFMDNTIYGGYYFFGGTCTLLLIGCYFLPETKGYSLEEIDQIFNPHSLE
ncbi:general substrate transporter [Radiomyces spectabilis]|uniref:general substrate transporter n=1 Tax=Radiomyces spectabilis TaxID=64574 RepID=UPI00221FBD41|nr:general substrate transporter [Radiomyces spectabilis]KAI8371409.1 general substrate transporter [Radiomyces spectabilis]